jgi:hypothetical protein
MGKGDGKLLEMLLVGEYDTICAISFFDHLCVRTHPSYNFFSGSVIGDEQYSLFVMLLALPLYLTPNPLVDQGSV